METFTRRFLPRYLIKFFVALIIIFPLDNTTTVNYTTQFLGVQYFVDLSIIQYATNINQSVSSVSLFDLSYDFFI
jgi:hypothetical protein